MTDTEQVHEGKPSKVSSRKAAADKLVADGVERQAKVVKEFNERLADAKPTPTQAEIDAVVAHDDPKDKDKAALQRNAVAGSSGAATYKTRDAAPAPAPARAVPLGLPAAKHDETKTDEHKK